MNVMIAKCLAVATGIYHCMNAEREMEYERVICETWVTDQPDMIFAFAYINGETYYRPGYWNGNEWIVPESKLTTND